MWMGHLASQSVSFIGLAVLTVLFSALALARCRP